MQQQPGTGTVTEQTPSRAEYFSWINNTNEGATEAQTLANLRFFGWLQREYGMQLDIYAFDAGNVDGAGFYGRTDSERFRRQFPRGWAPVSRAAGALGIRLGLWGGPDGFGETEADAQARIEMMESLCRDHAFALFKFDAVCGGLRPEKQPAFVRMMQACRRHVPDLILLNHRLQLGIGMPYATTFLWEGAETYVDVHMANSAPGLHSRLCTLQRGLPPELKRLTEDHGVCLSSCLDYWEDDLVLQAFNRCLILAPQLYGNPWLLRDDEYPRLARLFNLHRRFRDILVNGMTLPEEQYGPFAVSRGDGRTRFLTLRNLGWEPATIRVRLDESIGLEPAGEVELRRFHPYERFLGSFAWGSEAEVEVPAQRACLLAASAAGPEEVDVRGCDFEVVRDVPGRPVEVRLYGLPGTQAQISIAAGPPSIPPHAGGSEQSLLPPRAAGSEQSLLPPRAAGSEQSFLPPRAGGLRGGAFATASLDGEDAAGVLSPEGLTIAFPGVPLRAPWHRKLGDLASCPVPADAEALYEATCFAADNNALEVRELLRSGPTDIPEVQEARDAFFDQPLFRRRGLWDRNLHDDDPDTGLVVCRRWGDQRVRGGAFRLDLGRPMQIDHLELEVGGDYYLQPLKSQEAVHGSVSADLKTWTPLSLFADTDITGALPDAGPIRYVRLGRCPDRIRAVRGSYRGRPLDRTGWRASNLFAPYHSAPAVAAWSLDVELPDAPAGSYLAVPVFGTYGNELAYAAARVAGEYLGAPRRAPSFPSNTWEVPVRAVDGSYTYLFPLAPELAGRTVEVVVLALRGARLEGLRAEAWVTAYPPPYASRTLVLGG